MKKLLITGASGFLGWNLCQVAARQWQVHGTYRTRPVDLPTVVSIQVDLLDGVQRRELFQQVQPDAVIHLAAQSSPAGKCIPE